MNKQRVERQGPLVTKIVEGEPIRVGARELVPLVRVTTYARRRAHVGSGRLSGQGWGFVHLRPVAIVERSVAGKRRLPIRDKTAQMISGFVLAAIIILLLLALAARMVRK